MTDSMRCDYCGVKGAKSRRVGEAPTCHSHSDLPAIEHARELELDRLVADLYDRVGRSARRQSQPKLEG